MHATGKIFLQLGPTIWEIPYQAPLTASDKLWDSPWMGMPKDPEILLGIPSIGRAQAYGHAQQPWDSYNQTGPPSEVDGAQEVELHDGAPGRALLLPRIARVCGLIVWGVHTRTGQSFGRTRGIGGGAHSRTCLYSLHGALILVAVVGVLRDLLNAPRAAALQRGRQLDLAGVRRVSAHQGGKRNKEQRNKERAAAYGNPFFFFTTITPLVIVIVLAAAAATALVLAAALPCPRRRPPSRTPTAYPQPGRRKKIGLEARVCSTDTIGLSQIVNTIWSTRARQPSRTPRSCKIAHQRPRTARIRSNHILRCRPQRAVRPRVVALHPPSPRIASPRPMGSSTASATGLPPLPANVQFSPSVTRVSAVPLVGARAYIRELSSGEITEVQGWMAADRAYEERLRGMAGRANAELAAGPAGGHLIVTHEVFALSVIDNYGLSSSYHATIANSKQERLVSNDVSVAPTEGKLEVVRGTCRPRCGVAGIAQ
ncbi:hypothetical protein DFH11DRAFT_1546395 [Phellopilus nigrolimitatus]|nr:hypothetical protein DFH11DRAFT_1546395 [Phellopilus nigrolimitatus]